MIYSDGTSTKNGVVVILDDKMKSKVVEEGRKNDRINYGKICIPGKNIKCKSAYAP